MIMEIICLLATKRIYLPISFHKYHTKYGTSIRIESSLYYQFYRMGKSLWVLIRRICFFLHSAGDFEDPLCKLIRNHVHIYRYLFNELCVNRVEMNIRMDSNSYCFWSTIECQKKVVIEQRPAFELNELIISIQDRISIQKKIESCYSTCIFNAIEIE